MVALSGGADSVCLLHAMRGIAKKNGYRLSALHIHHHLRGREADRDAAFCRSLCEEWGITFLQQDCDVRKEKRPDESIEEAARRLRYDLFEAQSVDYILTAHHASDSLETFFINFGRGSGLRGLCGIPKNRGKYLRPLLSVTKEEILQYCTQQQLSFVTDSSNQEDGYTRNFIRHYIVPKFKEIFPALEKVAVRNFDLLKNDLDFIEQQAAKLMLAASVENGLSVAVLSAAHSALVCRVLADYCQQKTGRNPDAAHQKEMEKLCRNKQGEIGLFSDYRATVHNGIFSIFSTAEKFFETKMELCSVASIQKERIVHNLFLKNAVDYDKIVGELQLRCRRPKDRMRPNGRGYSKAVRRLQAEAGIPRCFRDSAPLATDEQGVVWGYQIGTSERVAVDDSTKNILIFKVYQTENRGQ